MRKVTMIVEPLGANAAVAQLSSSYHAICEEFNSAPVFAARGRRGGQFRR